MTDFKEIRRLFDIWDDSFGFSEEEVIECENRFGSKLPEILRDYYLQLGNNDAINQTQDSLVRPAKLKIEDSGFVIFYHENQWVWQAGLKFSDFELANPAVYLTYDEKTWEVESECLSDFLISISYLQALFALPFNANRIDVSFEKENLIRQYWQKINSTLPLWEVEFFQNDFSEILALMKSKNQTDIFIAARSEERFHQINEKLFIDWDYSSLEDE